MNPVNALARLRAGSVEPWLKLLMATAVAVPLLILLVVAWHDYDEAVTRATSRIERTTRLAREHAVRVFDTNDLVLRRVFDLLPGDSNALPQRAGELRARLAEMTAALREVRAIQVWNGEGRLVADNGTAPGSPTLGERAFFTNIMRAPPGALVIGETTRAPDGEMQFLVGRRRNDDMGQPSTLVTIALSAAYFTAFYEQLAGREPGLMLALVRPDGAVLTRFPDAPPPGTRVGSHNPLIPLITDAEATPVGIAISPEDGKRRYTNAQRIGAYPLFIETSVLQRSIVQEWLAAMWLPALVALAAAAALSLATWTTLRKTRREQQAVAQWREEAARRATAERMLSHLSQHLIRLSEIEKANLAAELHDELGGALSAISLDLSWVLERLKKKAPELVDRQNQAIKLVHETAVLKRRIIDGLRPMLLQHLGLAPALRDYVGQWSKKSGIPVDLQLADTTQTPPADAALALFRVVQESLTNVAKYAHAKRVGVALIEEDRAVGVTVTDDGVGIAPHILAHPTSHGLTGMQQRVAPFGGTFEIRSDPGKGTRVSARVPLSGDGSASTNGPITTDVAA